LGSLTSATSRASSSVSHHSLASRQDYINIIGALRQKVEDAEKLLRIKQNAKAEFAYNLQRNLMKSISNLSVEVIAINQMVLKDQRIDNSQTQKFLDHVSKVVGEKTECTVIPSG